MKVSYIGEIEIRSEKEMAREVKEGKRVAPAFPSSVVSLSLSFSIQSPKEEKKGPHRFQTPSRSLV